MPWYLDVVSKNMLTQKIRNQPSCINSLAGHDMRPAVQHDRCRRPRKVYGSTRELLRLQIQNADSSSAKGAATATKKKNNTETRSTKGKRNGTVGHWGPGEGSRFCWDNPMLDFCASFRFGVCLSFQHSFEKQSLPFRCLVCLRSLQLHVLVPDALWAWLPCRN